MRDSAIAFTFDEACAYALQKRDDERETAKYKAIAESGPFSGEAMVEMVS